MSQEESQAAVEEVKNEAKPPEAEAEKQEPEKEKVEVKEEQVEAKEAAEVKEEKKEPEAKEEEKPKAAPAVKEEKEEKAKEKVKEEKPKVKGEKAKAEKEPETKEEKVEDKKESEAKEEVNGDKTKPEAKDGKADKPPEPKKDSADAPKDLKDIKGLGDTSIEKLKEAQVTDLAGLVDADSDKLAEKTGLSKTKIESWQSKAKVKPPAEAAKPVTEDISPELARQREALIMWQPRTKLGGMVKRGEIKTMADALASGLPLKEVEIVDTLLPELGEEILDVGRVQRATDSGRRMRFRIVTVVGNRDGFVGIGVSKGKEAGPAIRKAIENAKLAIQPVKRGCGSWECGCGSPHTVPYRVGGKRGSVKVELNPAPRGLGLVGGEIPKKILELAGISDVWVKSSGYTRTSFNFAYAVFNALVATNKVKLRVGLAEQLHIVTGAIGAAAAPAVEEEGKPEESK